MGRPDLGVFLGLVSVLIPGFAAQGAPGAPAARIRVFTAGEPGVVRFDRQLLEEAGRQVGRFTIARFPLPNGDLVDLDVERFRVTGPNTRFVVGRAGGEDVPVEFGPSGVVLLRGKVAGKPQSDVFLALADGMSRGHIDAGDGRPRYQLSSRTSDERASGELVVVPAGSVRGGRPDVPLCGLETDGEAMPPEHVASPVRGGSTLGMKQIEIAIETDFELFEIFGDTTSTLTYLTELFGAVSHIYMRDVSAYYDITFIRLWTTPDDLFNEQDAFFAFSSYWNSYMTVSRDVAQFVSGRRDLPYGGIASLGALCSSSGYSVAGYVGSPLPPDPTAAFTGSYDIGVVAHELGHNCNAYHTQDYFPQIDRCYPPPTVYTRGEIMSYCSQTVSGVDNVTDLRFTTRIQSYMEGFIDSVGCVVDDCNLNGTTDALDLAQGTSADANANGQPDECEDCNTNGVLDSIDIAGGTSADADGHGVPDECEPDCNGNAMPDLYDVSSGSSADLWANGIPDECDPDCDGDGTADYNELQANMPLDINRNLVLDACEDCDADGTLDAVELAGAHSAWIASGVLSVVGQFHPITGVLMQNSDPALTEAGQDVLVLPDGRVLVSTRFNNLISAFNPDNGAFLGVFNQFTANLRYPTGMTLGPNGNVFVSSEDNGRVLEYNGTTGAFVRVFVASGADAPLFPYGLTFGPNGNLFVTSADGQVREYDGATGAFVRNFVSIADNGGLAWPREMTFKADGNLLVAGNANDAVLEFDGETGAFLGAFNNGGTLYGPWGVRVGPNGNVFVTRDYPGRNHVSTTRIYEYDVRNGNLVFSYLVGDDTGLFAPTGFAFAPGWERDCNVNAIPDNCDIAAGRSLAGDADGIPDECEIDCNGNGTSDRLDIVPFGRSLDCNWNRVPDECELAAGLGQDCNSNGRLDECEPDCNTNGVADSCDITAGTSADVIGVGGAADRVPDVCQADCNENLIPDELDIADGTSYDCTADGRPDECQVDCNDNGMQDVCDLSVGTSDDCNSNAVPDECESQADCNGNGVTDICDLGTEASNDCNGNGLPDECDIAAGTSTDTNANGIADECDSTGCFAVWAGFEPAPPFATGGYMDALDANADGHAWDNPTLSWSVGNQGCPSNQGKAIKGVAQTPPTSDYVTSEWFRTIGGSRLDCGAAIWSLAFDARAEAQLNPRIDWQMILSDASNHKKVIMLHWASTQSSYPGVPAAQRGKLLVRDPANPTAFLALNPAFTIVANTCHLVRVELNNVTGEVKLFVNNVLRLTTTRLEAGANRIDYFRMQQAANGQSSGGVNRLALDNFELCQSGAALPWADCNGDCQSDAVEIASGRARDCNANAAPDACDIAASLLSDGNANGIADGCIIAAVSRKVHGSAGTKDLTLNAAGRVQNGDVIGEPRLDGVTELRVAFDAPPGVPGVNPVSVLSQACGVCPCDPGAQAEYASTGLTPTSASVEGRELVLNFAPGLSGPATYRLEISPTVAGFAGGSLEVRSLLGDVNGDARTNASDRSLVVGFWTVGAFSAEMDVNFDGAVNATDRSLVVTQWTGGANCAP